MTDADEDAGTDDVGRIEEARPGFEGVERGFDLAKPLVDLVGQLVGLLVLCFELIELGAQRLARGALLVGESGRRAIELTQAVLVAIGENRLLPRSISSPRPRWSRLRPSASR